MLRNYLLVTFRNLVKNKVFTLINIFGLGIGLSVCIVAFFNHMFNYEFDRTHENFERDIPDYLLQGYAGEGTGIWYCSSNPWS